MRPHDHGTSSPARVIWRAVAALLLLWSTFAWASSSALRFERLGGIGMSDLSIMALAQDRQGFTWIGTSSGLFRYDGYQAVRYGNEPANPRSLPHDRVSEIFEDRLGRIWIGTQQGLARFDPKTNDFTRFAPNGGKKHAQLIVKKIASDGADGMWIATWGGLQHFDPRTAQFTLYTHDPEDPHSIASNDTNALVRDEVGGIWIATWPGGLDYLAPGSRKFRHYRIDSAERPDSKLNIARSLHIDADKNLWIGTEKGVMLLKAGAPWEDRYTLDTPSSRINRFYSDRSGTVWAGTLTAGLLRWERGSDATIHYRQRANDPHSLPSEDVRSLMQDRGGMLWIGTFTDGISLVNRNTRGFQRFIPNTQTESGELPGNSVHAMAGAPGGQLWLGNTRGVALFDPATGEVLRRHQARPGLPGALSNDIVYSLYQQPGGPLWVGTSAGLNRMEADGSFSVVRFDSLVTGFINTIAPSADGTLWLGTGADVIRFNPASGQWTNYRSLPGVAGSRSASGTTTILEDRRGRVWMGSEWNGGGLDMLDPATGKFRNFRHVPGDPTTLSDQNVSSLYEDARGRIWVGTAKGVHQVLTDADGRVTFRDYAIVGGSGVARAQAMLDDAAGKLWISTTTALIRLDPDRGTMARYTVTDGITAGFRLGTAYKSDAGKLYFGGNKGLTAVDPAKVVAVSVAPQVAITDISVLNRSLKEAHGTGAELAGTVTAPRALTLTADDTVFSVEFAALHYTNPRENHYAYRLVGFDSDWVRTNAEHRIATYTNLNPGTYRFEVKAANDDGVWNHDAAAFSVTILPPFWATWWFRTLAGVVAFGLLATAYRMRVRSLTRQQALLQQLVAERTRELEQTNRKLEELSTTDALTGVTNRRGFDHSLAREWRRAKRTGGQVALAMLDVDHFKSYNDRYGHQAGDQALRKVAAVIAAHARRTTDVVARYGGEEFALLAPSATMEQAMKMANAICEELRELALPHAGAPGGTITISIGVASMVPGTDQEPDVLIAQADQALYRAKQGGRNRAEGAHARYLSNGETEAADATA